MSGVSCMDASWTENRTRLHHDHVSLHIVVEPGPDYPRQNMWVGQLCMTTGTFAFSDRGREHFVRWWLNLCRALVPVGARIALELIEAGQRVRVETEEEIAMLALQAHLSWGEPARKIHGWRDPAEARCWDFVVSGVCRFCGHPVDNELSEFHTRHCGLEFWSNL